MAQVGLHPPPYGPQPGPKAIDDPARTHRTHRTTVTGHGAWVTTWRLTAPSSRPANAPRLRDRTTNISAPSRH